MPAPRQPEILPPGEKNLAPRFKRGSGFFADENLDMLSHVLDDLVPDPGNIRFAFELTAIIGLIPGLGDILRRPRLQHHHRSGVVRANSLHHVDADGRECRY